MSKKLQDTAYNYGAKTRSRKPVDWKARAEGAESELARTRKALEDEREALRLVMDEMQGIARAALSDAVTKRRA
jgi:hypothetical protein